MHQRFCRADVSSVGGNKAGCADVSSVGGNTAGCRSDEGTRSNGEAIIREEEAEVYGVSDLGERSAPYDPHTNQTRQGPSSQCGPSVNQSDPGHTK